MLEMEGTTKPPQISEMFHKFAHVVRTKTFELFADDENNSIAADNNNDTDVFTLLDSAEEFIPDQKVVVIKPDFCKFPHLANTHVSKSLISSLFATISSFEASYLQLQTAHVPFDEKAIESADKALVSVLQKLTDMKNLYKDFRRNPSCNVDVLMGSELEFQVQEHQSKLRVLETMVNQLLSYMESKDEEVSVLRKKLDKIHDSNSRLSKKLGVEEDEKSNNTTTEVLCTFRVFESMLRDSIKSANKFSKLLMELMKRAGWDLEKAANSVYSDVNYSEKEHHKYAFLSYICLGMFKGFDLEDFGLCDEEVLSNGSISDENDHLKQLLEHVSCNPMETLNKNPNCAFSRFCDRKYEQIIHPTIESSIFRDLDGKEVIVDSWKSLSVFYELFVRMASTIWLLHKLAYSFTPVVEIFQVERGVDFSVVYAEDVTRKIQFPLSKTRPKVGFTVVPGFKIGSTIIQTQVYLTGLKCME